MCYILCQLYLSSIWCWRAFSHEKPIGYPRCLITTTESIRHDIQAGSEGSLINERDQIHTGTGQENLLYRLLLGSL